MRQDKLTTKLQEAIADAQSLAVGNDNQYVDPVHLLAALLQQNDGSTRSLLQRAGVNVNRLATSLKTAMDRLPKVSGTGAMSRSGGNWSMCSIWLIVKPRNAMTSSSPAK